MRMNFRAAAILAVAAASLLTSTVATAAEKRIAFSKKLGVEVLASGDVGGWCQIEPKLRVVARDQSFFESAEFQGLVRQVGSHVVATECAAAQRVILSGSTTNSRDVVFTGKAAKSDDWTLRPGNPEVSSGGAAAASSSDTVASATEPCKSEYHELAPGGTACGIGFSTERRLTVGGKPVTGRSLWAARSATVFPASPSGRYAVVRDDESFMYLLDLQVPRAVPLPSGNGFARWIAWSEDESHVLLVSRDMSAGEARPLKWLHAMRIPSADEGFFPKAKRLPFDASALYPEALLSSGVGTAAFAWVGPRRFRVQVGPCRGTSACEATRVPDDLTSVEFELTESGPEVVAIADAAKAPVAMRRALQRTVLRQIAGARGNQCRQTVEEVPLGGAACGIGLSQAHELVVDGRALADIREQSYRDVAEKPSLHVFPGSPSGRYAVVSVCAPDCRWLFLVDRQARRLRSVPTAVYGPERWIAWTEDEEYFLLSNYDDGVHWLQSVGVPRSPDGELRSNMAKFIGHIPVEDSFEWLEPRRFRVAVACRGESCETTNYPQDLTDVELELKDGAFHVVAIGDPSKVSVALRAALLDRQAEIGARCMKKAAANQGGTAADLSSSDREGGTGADAASSTRGQNGTIVLPALTYNAYGGTVTLSEIAISGARQSRADLVAALDPHGPGSLAQRLNALSADKVEIPRIEWRRVADQVETRVVYAKVEARDVRDGVIGSADVCAAQVETQSLGRGPDAGQPVPGGFPKISTTFGFQAFQAVDLPSILGLMGEPSDTAALRDRPLFKAWDIDGIKTRTPAGQAGELLMVSWGPITLRDVKAGGWPAVSAAVEASGSGHGDAVDEGLKGLDAALSIFGSAQIGEASIEGFLFTETVPRKRTSTVTAGRISYDARSAKTTVDSLAWNERGKGQLRTGRITLEGDMAAMLGGVADGRGTAPVVMGNASAPGPLGLSITAIDFESDGASAGVRERVSVGSIETRVGKFVDGAPHEVAVQLNNVTAQLPTDSRDTFLQDLRRAGIGSIDFSMALSGAWDEEHSVLELTNLGLEIDQLFRVSLSAQVGNVSRGIFRSGSPIESAAGLLAASAQRLRVSFVNLGVMDKILNFAAQKEGKSAAALRTEWTYAALLAVTSVLGDHPDARAVADAVSKFMRNQKAIDVQAASRDQAGISFRDLGGLAKSGGALKRVTFTAIAE